MRAVLLCLLCLPAIAAAAPKEVPMPTDASPQIGPVMAIEVERDATDRKLTRDAAAVKTVLDAIGPPTSWTPGGTPRCRPQLWARLVPTNGEGGASFLFCDPSSPGHLSIPGHGSFRLSDEASRAVHQATSRLQLPEAGSIAPVLVTDHLDTLLVRATIAPGQGASTGLRSVTLSRGHRLEPDAVHPDTTPIGRSFELTDAQATELAGVLALGGFFQRAKAYVSPAVEAPGDAPEGRIEGTPPQPNAPAGWVSVTVTSGGWHHTWREAHASAIFAHTVNHLGRAGLGDDVHAALGELPPQLE